MGDLPPGDHSVWFLVRPTMGPHCGAIAPDSDVPNECNEGVQFEVRYTSGTERTVSQ